ncbi:MAG: endonuclease/exonuclease/phosphatase family protein, partial [Myxococcota bacterium]
MPSRLRRRVLWFFAGAVAVASIGAFYSSPLHETPSDAISALTFNVLFDNADIESNVDAIRDADADILCLQEITSDFEKAFRSSLATRYPFRHFESRSGTWGIGVASKYPLRDIEVFEQSPHRMPAIAASLSIDNERLQVACVHLFPPTAKRDEEETFWETYLANEQLRLRQAERLTDKFRNAKHLLLLGDLNDFDKALSVLSNSGLKDGCEVRGSSCGPTYPGAKSVAPAVVTIDYILGRGVTFVSAARLKRGSSDHYPVQAWFRIE